MTNPDERRVLETTTGPETLEKIQRILDELWSAHDIPELVRMHTDLAVSEIGANIIEHSGDGGPVRLRMEVEVVPGVVRVTFTDNGHPAPVDLSHVAMPDEMSERGRGAWPSPTGCSTNSPTAATARAITGRWCVTSVLSGQPPHGRRWCPATHPWFRA